MMKRADADPINEMTLGQVIPGKMEGRTFGVQSLRWRSPVVSCVIGWLGPEVMLSLLPEQLWIIP